MSPGLIEPKPAVVSVFFGENMPTIEFTQSTEYVVATENGGRETIKIDKGTVMNVNEASAARWERRNVAKRLTGVRSAAPVPATPTFAPPPPPPTETERPAAAPVPATPTFAPPPPPPAEEF